MPVTLNSALQVLIFLVLVLLITKPMGVYLTRVFTGDAPGSRPSASPSNGSFIASVG